MCLVTWQFATGENPDANGVNRWCSSVHVPLFVICVTFLQNVFQNMDKNKWIDKKTIQMAYL